jgi:glycosyltransferase involved in cell wall biosynthesis
MSNTCLVAQIGARMHYAVPRLLHREGRLERLYTDICAAKGWPRALTLVPPPLRPAKMRRLLGRIPQGVPGSQITAFTNFGCEYARRLARSSTPSETTSALLWAGSTFCKKVIAHGLGKAAVVYAFNNAALELLQHAHAHGRIAVLEQTIAPKQIECEWLRGEHEKFPGWEPMPGQDPCLAPFLAREAAEWQAADRIVCGSEFVQKGIARCGGPVDRCRVVPYGVDSFFQVPDRAPHPGPLRVLTVGTIGLRKGSPYVLAAARRLRPGTTFRMVGEVKVDSTIGARLRETVDLAGPVPRSEMLSHFQWADVFLLPSLCEGSATAACEALACGLPVIATPNTGTVARDGIEGFIVRAGDLDGIVESLEKLIGNRDLLREMSQSARRRSAQFDFAAYRKNLLAALQLDDPKPLECEQPVYAQSR